MLGSRTTVIVLSLFSNFIVRLGGIGILLVAVGSLIVHRSDPVRVLRRSTHKQPTRRAVIQIIVGVGMVLCGVLLIYQSFTIQLPGAV